jgi:hypothetical protein
MLLIDLWLVNIILITVVSRRKDYGDDHWFLELSFALLSGEFIFSILYYQNTLLKTIISIKLSNGSSKSGVLSQVETKSLKSNIESTHKVNKPINPVKTIKSSHIPTTKPILSLYIEYIIDLVEVEVEVEVEDHMQLLRTDKNLRRYTVFNHLFNLINLFYTQTIYLKV